MIVTVECREGQLKGETNLYTKNSVFEEIKKAVTKVDVPLPDNELFWPF